MAVKKTKKLSAQTATTTVATGEKFAKVDANGRVTLIDLANLKTALLGGLNLNGMMDGVFIMYHRKSDASQVDGFTERRRNRRRRGSRRGRQSAGSGTHRSRQRRYFVEFRSRERWRDYHQRPRNSYERLERQSKHRVYHFKKHVGRRHQHQRIRPRFLQPL